MSCDPYRYNPLGRYEEWLDHRYDPGYFLGGRLPPYLTARRPNRYGWVLIAMGLLPMAASASVMIWPGLLLWGGSDNARRGVFIRRLRR